VATSPKGGKLCEPWPLLKSGRHDVLSKALQRACPPFMPLTRLLLPWQGFKEAVIGIPGIYNIGFNQKVNHIMVSFQ
jgi:hypothetical protein